jgi:hypothetical protein
MQGGKGRPGLQDEVELARWGLGSAPWTEGTGRSLAQSVDYLNQYRNP